jgi:hypothetical protein
MGSQTSCTITGATSDGCCGRTRAPALILSPSADDEVDARVRGCNEKVEGCDRKTGGTEMIEDDLELLVGFRSGIPAPDKEKVQRVYQLATRPRPRWRVLPWVAYPAGHGLR